MSKIPSTNDLEQGLEYLFPEPGAAFAERLERQLMEQAARNSAALTSASLASAAAETAGRSRRSQRQAPPRRWWQISWRMGVAAGLAALALVVAAVGPQKALAAVQRLIGYVPGIGFVDSAQPTLRVLAEPVQAERDGVTLTVEKALATGESTLVRIRVDGIPRDKSLFEQGWGESHLARLQEGRLDAASPDGQTLTASGSFSGAGEFVWSEYTFPPLGEGVETITLLLNRLPGLAAGAAPEGWAVEIPLREVSSGDGLVEATLAPQAGPPASGARLELESLAATSEQAALQVRLVSEDPQRRPDSEWWRGVVLADDQGQELPLTREEPFNLGLGTRSDSVVLLAPPLDPDRTYTLRVEQAVFEYRFGSLQKPPRVHLPVPGGVQVGQAWEVDESLEAGGYQLHITQASLEDSPVAGPVEGDVLRLSIEPQPGLVGVGLNCADMEVCSSSGFELAQPGKALITEVYLDEIPDRAIDLRAQILLEEAHGPWEVSFQVEP